MEPLKPVSIRKWKWSASDRRSRSGETAPARESETGSREDIRRIATTAVSGMIETGRGRAATEEGTAAEVGAIERRIEFIKIMEDLIT